MKSGVFARHVIDTAIDVALVALATWMAVEMFA